MPLSDSSCVCMCVMCMHVCLCVCDVRGGRAKLFSDDQIKKHMEHTARLRNTWNGHMKAKSTGGM